MREPKFVTVFIFLCLILRGLPSFGATATDLSTTEECAKAVADLERLEPLAKHEKKNGEYTYKGLTEEGVKVLTREHNNLVTSEQIISSRLLEGESFRFTNRIVEAGKWNGMILGPPGGAKTATFLLMYPEIWIKQVHAMMNEVALIGGTSEADVQAGRDGLNIKGTMLDGVKVAMIDEGEKLNPAVQSTLLSLLNTGERFVTAGGKRVYAPDLRSVFYTGNATLPEILEYFQMQGGGTTGPAFLNRFMAKYRVSNWLAEESQEVIDRIKAKRFYYKAVAKAHPEVLKDLVFQDPPQVDAAAIEEFAQAAFELTPEAEVVMRTFIGQLKNLTNEAVRTSDKRNKESAEEEPYVLSPSVEFSERVRGDIAQWVCISAALDFLRSPMATPENIKKFAAHKIQLGPRSLWRTWNMLTTVTGNRTIFDPFSKNIYFGARLKNGKILPSTAEADMANAKDMREMNELKHIKEAQERFLTSITTKWTSMNTSLEETAKLMNNDIDDLNFENVDYEMALARLGGTDVMKITPDAVAAPADSKGSNAAATKKK